MIKNLVFEGGGVRGIAYGGALDVLQNHIDIKGVDNYAGTSAGAITSALLAMDYSPEDLIDVMNGLDFTKFEDNSAGFFRDIYRFITTYGWNKGDYLENWLQQQIDSKFGAGTILTFSSLFDRTGNSLYVVATNLTQGKSVTFNKDTNPDMNIVTAVRASMSIPFFFSAVRINGDHYADGGLLNNFPIRVFDKVCFMTDCDDTRPAYNPLTLGFRVDDTSEIEHDTSNSTKSILGYTKAVMSIIYNTLQRKHLTSSDWARTVRIPVDKVSTVEFDLSDAKRDYLVESGRQATSKYFDK